MARHVVAPVGEIPAGGCKLVSIGNRAIVVFNVNGEFFALNNRCPHKGGRLSEGEFVNGVIVCPNHRWEFCAHSGRGINPAGAQLNRYAVQIVDGRILIAARTP